MKYIFSTVLLLFLSANAFAQSSVNDTISLTLNEQNTMYINAIFNGTDTLNLNFDTGSSDLTLTNEAIKNKLKSKIELYKTPYQLRIGNGIYETTVYDAELSGHDTDGRFGWNLFKDKVVEIDYDQNIMVVHSQTPKLVLNDSTYSKLGITYFDNVFSVESKLIQDGFESKDRFLFDTGYQRTAMLDNDLLKAVNFPIEKMEEIKTSIMKGSLGNEIPVIISDLERLKIGKHELKNVPVQQLTSHKPLRGVNIHILGNEVLKRFNTFFDFKNHMIYLKPNKLYNEEYAEKRRSDI